MATGGEHGRYDDWMPKLWLGSRHWTSVMEIPRQDVDYHLMRQSEPSGGETVEGWEIVVRKGERESWKGQTVKNSKARVLMVK